jgi:imidazolonepropionase-like amidohydrolase
MHVVGCRGSDTDPTLVITADLVFTGQAPIEDGAVAIRGAEIVAVGTADDLLEGAEETITLGDATILPGLIDLHVHGAENVAKLFVDGGVTTVRDLGSELLTLQRAPHRMGGLRILRAGPIITAPNGYPVPVFGSRVALPIRGEVQARAAVRRVADAGAAVIKIAVDRGFRGTWPVLSTPEIRAIVDEAHAHGLTVTAHVTSPEDAERAVSGGVDELAHMPCSAPAAATMRAFARREIPIVGTLHVEQTFRCPATVANATAFVAAGGTLLYGTDYGNPLIPAGIDVDELRLMARAGLSPREVLENATARAADELNNRRTGTLAPGLTADIIAVSGNALQDLGHLAEIQLVISNGRIVKRS